MVQRPVTKGLPPYTPYATWLELIDWLRKGLPDRIDDSYLQYLRVNQAIRSTLYTTLRFLQLVDEEDRPNDALAALVGSQGEEHREKLREVVNRCYNPILRGIRLKSATPDQLRDKFQEQGANGDVVRKCFSFFVAIADDAGLDLSPHIPRRRRQAKGRMHKKSTPATAETPKVHQAADRDDLVLPDTATKAASSSLALILAKFPDYDASWDDATAIRWRESVALILTALKPEDEGPGS